jgi:hypothetical protein
MIHWKRFGRKRLWPNCNALSRLSSGGIEETRGKLSQDSRSPVRDSNPGPVKYGALTTLQNAGGGCVLLLCVRNVLVVRGSHAVQMVHQHAGPQQLCGLVQSSRSLWFSSPDVTVAVIGVCC